MRIYCNLPNASELISGVKFSKNGDGIMVADDVPDAQAAIFLKINGFYTDPEPEQASSGETGADAVVQQQTTPPEAPKAPPKKPTAAAKPAAADSTDEQQSGGTDAVF